MVVSKDNKRRRKEMETPPLPPSVVSTPTTSAAAAAAVSAAVESSPEMPKRTKVQAQRKFAQGQSAPSSSTSAFSALAAAAAVAGPSSSTDSRDPPIEVLPNKRPKTQDFLTFLCFRNTSTLPPHLDYLNQGNSKEAENSTNTTTTTTPTAKRKKNNNKASSTANKKINNNKKGKRGRPKAIANTKNDDAGAALGEATILETKTTKKPLELSSSAAALNASANSSDKKSKASPTIVESKSDKVLDVSEPVPELPLAAATATVIIPGAVRKRAEVVSEGNRRNRRTAAIIAASSLEDSKCNSNSSINKTHPEVKRRSNRTSTKEGRPMIEPDTDDEEDDEEFYSVHDVGSKVADNDVLTDDVEKSTQKNNNLKVNKILENKIRRTPIERKSETPSKDSETGRSASKRGRPSSTTATSANKKSDAGKNNNESVATPTEKSKGPVKRVRQRESPIFIPSPESSGRMTRQRAFFEPVKVIPLPTDNGNKTDSKDDADSNKKNDSVDSDNNDDAEEEETNIDVKQTPNNSKEIKPQNSSIYAKEAKSHLENGKSSLNVFDFSSDDEQPLAAKAIKLKKGKTASSPRKQNAANSGGTTNIRRRKVTGVTAGKKLATEKDNTDETATDDPPTPSKSKDQQAKEVTEATKPKRGRAAKKKADDSFSYQLDEDLPPSPKRPTTTSSRQSRGKAKDTEQNDTTSPSQAPARNQRPTRKTKEAAAVYMNIIGHKLQRADDEEDDLSLDSFPEIPNVKEMEKMENQIKKNAAQKEQPSGKLVSPAATKSAASLRKPSPKPPPPAPEKVPSKALTTTTSQSIPPASEKKSNEKPPARRGRPPKQAKALPLPPKREIEGMLVKKGALTKIATAAAATAEATSTNSTEDATKPKGAKSELGKGVGGGDTGGDDDENEDFLINEELNETKRKLEKSFSDSDDEPLAIKVNVKGSDKDGTTPLPSPKSFHSPEKTTISAATGTTAPAPKTSTPIATSIAMEPIVPPTITPAQLPIMPLAVKHTPTLLATAAATTNNPLGSSASILPSNINPLAPIHAIQPITTAAASLAVGSSTGTIFSPQLITPPSIASGSLKIIEKKSPVPTSKILNVPATYSLPGAGPSPIAMSAAAFNKTTSPYLPQASPHYLTPYVRPPPTPTHPFSAPTPATSKSPITTQSPLKYQTPPTTYPPPIEAYQCPKINPNFLTPKFDRTSLPRTNNFPSPSPMKFEAPRPVGSIANLAASLPAVSITASSTFNQVSIVGPTKLVTPSSVNLPPSITPSISNAVTPSTSAAAAAAAAASLAAAASATMASPQLPNALTNASNAANASADPLKDEIGSILAANLMPSKEESGKIFGIASVSLAQSSGPDNTKCTLGKCGSIHKPVLGPVVPTEGYFGDQLTSKERRKAKVNMTHEQIQKWLIECSSNPDEIQDDLDDDFDDNLRPNQSTTPPLTRDDKESTSFSSSSKNTRELGKSESAWSAKGPSLKATPVVASRKEDDHKDIHDLDYDKPLQAVNLSQKASALLNLHDSSGGCHGLSLSATTSKEQTADKRIDKKGVKDAAKTGVNNRESSLAAHGDNNNKKQAQNKANLSSSHAAAGSSSNDKSLSSAAESNSKDAPQTTTKQNRNKKNAPSASANSTPTTPSSTAAAANKSSSTNTTPKRTPVYNQKTGAAAASKQGNEPKSSSSSSLPVSPTKTSNNSSQKRSTLQQKDVAVYAFGKDDDRTGNSKPAYKRQGQQQQQQQKGAKGQGDSEVSKTVTNALSERSPTKKRAAAAAAATAVSLTLSPTENCKLVKVSMDAPTKAPKSTRANAKKSSETIAPPPPPPPTSSSTSSKVTPAANDVDSDAEGATFYIPLQGAGVGGSADGNIQGVAVKLGREGPDGPNQKVVMQATLVTKAQMDTNTKPLPDSLNTTELVKTLLNASNATDVTTAASSSTTAPTINAGKKVNASTLGVATGGTAGTNSASNSLKNVPIGNNGTTSSGGQNRLKSSSNTTEQPTTSNAGLVRVNSNSSLFSGSAKSRTTIPSLSTTNALLAKKFKDDTPIKMANNTAFPRHDDPTQMVEAPIFRPTEKEFADPIEFIERITPIAARFGICKIIPPATFKPECRISDEMRFTAYNQYVHKMLNRWGPSAKELSAIKKYLATQSIVMNHPPWIGGMEVDLPRLYHTVQELGGLKEVIEKKKWARVAEEMCIPKLAQDRVTKLDDIYCKYLLPYDTLSPAERQKLFDEVEADWAKREARARRNADRFVNTESVSNEEDDVSSDEDDESEEEIDGVSMECIVKGRSMPLSQFCRIARNTMALWFKNADPTVNEVEAEFWRHVAVRDSHVCVHSGSIDSSGWGYGFPSPGPKGKGSNYARHPWNLKVLTNNPGSVLRSLGPVMGVTVPTLHVGMLFSACCWYRDPHGLSWIEYLHTGASKLWYGIPDDQSANFRAALTSLIPTHCQNKTIWLPCDTVMVPPHMLTDRGVSLCRIEQKPGEFIVVFPRAYTSSLATGYVVSESVYFATMSWLELAKDDFRDIHDSCEPAMFSLEQLLFALGYDQRVNSDTLQQMLPMLNDVCEKETAAREQLKAAGVTSAEKIQTEKNNKAKKQQPQLKSIESECDLCRANLYISMVRTEEGNIYCLQHALKNLNNGNIQAKQCKLIYAFNVDDIQLLIKSLQDKIQHKRITSAGGVGGGGKKSK